MFGSAVHIIIVMTGHDDEVSHAEAFEADASRNHREFVEVRLAKEAADRRMAYGAEASALLAHDLDNGDIAPTRIHQGLESVLEVSASSLGRGVTISIDCKTDLMARFDPALVERVLHNLVGKAARYCSQSGTIVAAARRWNDDSVEIAVTNSGPLTHLAAGLAAGAWGKVDSR